MKILEKVINVLDGLSEGKKLVILVILGLGLAIGGFYAKKWFNYTFFYEDSVKTEMAPLKARIKVLEKEYIQLSKNTLLILEKSKEGTRLDKIILKQQKQILEQQRIILNKG